MHKLATNLSPSSVHQWCIITIIRHKSYHKCKFATACWYILTGCV